MIRAFQWDLGRQVERLDWLLGQLPRYADWGYTELYLHLEDAVEFPSLPGVARRDAYSRRELERLVVEAARVGIGTVPIVNLLGHTQYLIKVPELRELNELRGPDGLPLETGQVCPVHPRMLDIADALIGDMAPYCTAGKVHVGLDESFSLGRHPLSRAEIAEIGLAAHFARYVGRLNGVAAGRGLRLGMWADMLALLPSAIRMLPPGIAAYDWYYYPFGRRPRIELRNFAEYDLAPALRARGIEYWGCPMNGSFRHEPLPVFGERLGNLRSWWRRCADVGAEGFLVTSWEPNRLAMEMTTAVDAAAASLWLDPGADDSTEMLARGFGRLYGAAGSRELARSALACDERAFAGNSRWEVNERWDTASTRRGLGRYVAERAFYRRLSSRGPSLPRAFAASVAFRLYLAERDVFVRESADQVFDLRRRFARRGPADKVLFGRLGALLASAVHFGGVARRAGASARRLWALSRDPSVRGPNEAIAARDAARAGALARWVKGCLRRPDRLTSASPVCGRWQLRLDVVLDRPALQRVVVELGLPGGSWKTLHARTQIEFRAEAARPLARLRREMSVPVPGPDARLRIAVRGLGSVGLSRPELTDGVTTLLARNWRPSEVREVGRPAPRAGFPRLDWERNAGSTTVSFSA